MNHTEQQKTNPDISWKLRYTSPRKYARIQHLFQEKKQKNVEVSGMIGAHGVDPDRGYAMLQDIEIGRKIMEQVLEGLVQDPFWNRDVWLQNLLRDMDSLSVDHLVQIYEYLSEVKNNPVQNRGVAKAINIVLEKVKEKIPSDPYIAVIDAHFARS